jgi:hypothetical protein
MITLEYAYTFRVGIAVFIATKLRAGGKFQEGQEMFSFSTGYFWSSYIVVSNRFQRLFLGG